MDNWKHLPCHKIYHITRLRKHCTKFIRKLYTIEHLFTHETVFPFKRNLKVKDVIA